MIEALSNRLSGLAFEFRGEPLRQIQHAVSKGQKYELQIRIVLSDGNQAAKSLLKFNFRKFCLGFYQPRSLPSQV
jgi:hypothetical protein